MNTNQETKLLLKEEVYQIVGAAIEVLNEIGHGIHEKPYENALVVEFGIRSIPFNQQAQFDVLAKLQINKEAFKTTVRRLWPFLRRRMIWRRL